MIIENPKFWHRINQSKISRRQALQAVGIGTSSVLISTAIGCESDRNPAKYTINLPASENRVQAIQEMFENAPKTFITMLPRINESSGPSLDNIWRTGGARVTREGIFGRYIGNLTILLNEQYSEPEGEYKGAFITNNEHELSVDKIQIRRAQEALDDDLLSPEDYNKMVVEIAFSDGTRETSVDDLREKTPFDIYLEIQTSSNTDKPLRRVFEVKPLSDA